MLNKNNSNNNKNNNKALLIHSTLPYHILSLLSLGSVFWSPPVLTGRILPILAAKCLATPIASYKLVIYKCFHWYKLQEGFFLFCRFFFNIKSAAWCSRKLHNESSGSKSDSEVPAARRKQWAAKRSETNKQTKKNTRGSLRWLFVAYYSGGSLRWAILCPLSRCNYAVTLHSAVTKHIDCGQSKCHVCPVWAR